RQTVAAMGGRAGTAALGRAGTLRCPRPIFAAVADRAGHRAAGNFTARQPARRLRGTRTGIGGPLAPAARSLRPLVRSGGVGRTAARDGKGLSALLADLSICAD